jgi:hypothetical protein
MGTHDKLVQKAIEQIAKKIHKEEKEKGARPTPRTQLLRRASRLFAQAVKPPCHNDDDDDVADIYTRDIVAVLIGQGVKQETAAQLAPKIAENVNGFDGYD